VPSIRHLAPIASGFKLNESEERIRESGRKIGRGGHRPFVMLLMESDGAVQAWLKFSDYRKVLRVIFEPGRLWAGLSCYIKRDYDFHIALYDLAKRCFEELDAEAVEAVHEGLEEPWYRYSKNKDLFHFLS